MKTLSAIILTGGKSQRMGTPKHNIKFKNKTLLETAISKVSQITSGIFISGNPEMLPDLTYPTVPDEITECGPIGGLFSSLKAIETSDALVIPVDMPFLDSKVLEKLIKIHSKDSLATVAFYQGQLQPLCAVYSKKCLPIITKQIGNGDFKMQNFLGKIVFKEVLFDNSMPFVSEKTFLNINTPSNLKYLN